MFTDLAGSTSLVEAIGDAAWHDLSAWLDGELRHLRLARGPQGGRQAA